MFRIKSKKLYQKAVITTFPSTVNREETLLPTLVPRWVNTPVIKTICLRVLAGKAEAMHHSVPADPLALLEKRIPFLIFLKEPTNMHLMTTEEPWKQKSSKRKMVLPFWLTNSWGIFLKRSGGDITGLLNLTRSSSSTLKDSLIWRTSLSSHSSNVFTLRVMAAKALPVWSNAHRWDHCSSRRILFKRLKALTIWRSLDNSILMITW